MNAPLNGRNSRYPTELIDVWHCGNGTRYTLRPVLPQDRQGLADMILRLSKSSRYRRFHGTIAQLPDHMLDSMTDVDHHRHVALVVTTVQADVELVVADARYYVDEQGEAAEFALMVSDERQRRGLGLRALEALNRAATRQGLRWLHGSVLSGNVPMLSLMVRYGFTCTPDRHEADLVRVERQVGKAVADFGPVKKIHWCSRSLQSLCAEIVRLDKRGRFGWARHARRP
jgi:acetyltransferase